LPKLKIAHVIGKAVWEQGGDIRDVISIGKLVRKSDGPEEVEQILATMTKYEVHTFTTYNPKSTSMAAQSDNDNQK
jgi:hypothetical protein